MGGSSSTTEKPKGNERNNLSNQENDTNYVFELFSDEAVDRQRKDALDTDSFNVVCFQ